jgi:hypothetical protein
MLLPVVFGVPSAEVNFGLVAYIFLIANYFDSCSNKKLQTFNSAIAGYTFKFWKCKCQAFVKKNEIWTMAITLKIVSFVNVVNYNSDQRDTIPCTSLYS